MRSTVTGRVLWRYTDGPRHADRSRGKVGFRPPISEISTSIEEPLSQVRGRSPKHRKSLPSASEFRGEKYSFTLTSAIPKNDLRFYNVQC